MQIGEFLFYLKRPISNIGLLVLVFIMQVSILLVINPAVQGGSTMKKTVILLALALVSPLAFAQEKEKATAATATPVVHVAAASQVTQDASKGHITYQGRVHNMQYAETVDARWKDVAPNTVRTNNGFVEQLTPKEQRLRLDDQRDPNVPAPAIEPRRISISDITVLNGANPHEIARREYTNFSGSGFAEVRNNKDPNNLSAGHVNSGGLGTYEVRTCTVEGCRVRQTSIQGKFEPGWEKLDTQQLKDKLNAKIEEARALQSVKLDPGTNN